MVNCELANRSENYKNDRQKPTLNNKAQGGNKRYHFLGSFKNQAIDFQHIELSKSSKSGTPFK